MTNITINSVESTISQDLNSSLGNFTILPNDVMLYIMKDLSNDTLTKLYQTNKAFLLFFKKFDIIKKRAKIELKRLSPLSELLDIEKQILAIRRGQVTPYTVRTIFSERTLKIEVRMGLHKTDGDDHIISFPGSPPPVGTIIWIAGLLHGDPNAEETEYVHVFPNEEEALKLLLENHRGWFQHNNVFNTGGGRRDDLSFEQKIELLKEIGLNDYGYVNILLKKVILP
jgi:hypothetical protein